MTKKQLEDKYSQFDAEELLALVRFDIDSRAYEQGLAKIKAVLYRKEPPDEVYSIAARIYAQLRLYSKARELYMQFLEKRPDALVERFQLGMTHFDLGEVDEALKVWEQVIDTHAGHPPALFYKGLALSRKGRAADAEKTLNKLLERVTADNLYFGKARDLLSAIRQGKHMEPSSSKTKERQRPVNVLPEDAYKTEH